MMVPGAPRRIFDFHSEVLMNEKEIGELRRRFRADKSNISHVRGCYVNEKKEIISQFDQSIALMGPEESEKLLGILRKTLSGTLGKNLLDITFDTRQVVEGDEHRLLMALRDSELRDQEAVEALFQRAIQSLDLEGNYLILLAYDAYDVPYRSKDGDSQADASSDVFRYILCSVCPVKLTKDALSYFVYENKFRNLEADWVVAAPEAGFLFPAFDDRAANIYNALFYSKNVELVHEEVIDAVFRVEPPMSAVEQKNVFDTALADTLEKDCSYDVVQSVHEQLRGRIQEHKESRDPAPLELTVGDVGGILSESGVSEEKVESFRRECEKQYGENAALNPKNILGTGKFEITTPEVKITVAPENSYLIEARMIGGRRYLLIPADDGVEVNGVSVSIPNEEHS